MTPEQHQPHTSSKIVRGMTHPLFIVMVVGLVFGNTAVWTLSYDSAYLPYSTAWSVIAMIGACASFATVRWMDERVAVGTGAIITITSFARACANLWQSIHGPADLDDVATLRVGAGVWLLITILIYTLWTRLVLPWIVLFRRREMLK